MVLAKKSIQIVRYIFFLFLEENMLWVLIRSAVGQTDFDHLLVRDK